MRNSDDHLAGVRAAIAEARSRLADEISAYPTPIAGCDAQFNHLLAVRRRLRLAEAALDADVAVPTPRAPG